MGKGGVIARSGTIIPARFLITTGHFVAVLLTWQHADENARAGLEAAASDTRVGEAVAEIQVVVGLSILCFALDYASLFLGFSLFHNTANIIQCVIYFVGSLYTCWYVMDEWHYKVMWHLWLFFSVTPAIIELYFLFKIFVAKSERF